MRLIDDSDLINMLSWWVQGHENDIFTGKDIEKGIMGMIRQAPTIPVQRPVIHAHWIRHGGNEKYDECSNCHCAYNSCGWDICRSRKNFNHLNGKEVDRYRRQSYLYHI